MRPTKFIVYILNGRMYEGMAVFDTAEDANDYMQRLAKAGWQSELRIKPCKEVE